MTILKRDRRTGFIYAVAAGVGAGIALGALFGSFRGAWAGAWIGISSMILCGVLALSDIAAWPYYETARIWLVLHGRLPWPLMDFLADAHKRGVLRQAGAVYQFRHIELQHRLANRDASDEEKMSSAATPPTANP